MKELRPRVLFGNANSQACAMYAMREKMDARGNIRDMQGLRKHDAVLWADPLIVHALEQEYRWCISRDVVLP